MNKKFLKVLLIELAIALVLLIIIIKIPSHRKLKKVSSKSLNYEHVAASLSVDGSGQNTNDGTNDDSRADIDSNRGKGGYSSYEEGNYKPAEGTTDTPTPSADDKGTDNPGTTDPGTDEKKTDDPGTADPKGTDEPAKTNDDTKTAAATGKTCKVICEGSVRLRSKPDSRDDHNAVYLAMAGEILDVVSTDVQTDDPDTTEWYLVKKQDKRYNRELYVPAKYVELQ